MIMNSKKLISFIFLYTIITSLLLNSSVIGKELENGYYTIKEKGTDNIVFYTGRYINIGDKYLNQENSLYEIVEVENNLGYAVHSEDIDLSDYLNINNLALANIVVKEDNQDKRIGIYHTHSDESYEPTDGEYSIEGNVDGGVYKVGEAFKEALEEKGINAIQSLNTHDPHDASAYVRSRRTAEEILKEGVDAKFDIHRDAVPAEAYAGEINGEQIATVQLVVGRQNPNKEPVDNFAKQLKATGDELYPGLVKGIFYAKGSYNQDMAPRSMLIEAGTYKNTREQAKKGIVYFSEVVAQTLYGEDLEKDTGFGGFTSPITGEGGAILRGILWMFVLFILGVGGYFLITGNSIEETKNKLKDFSKREFANYLKNKSDKEDDE